MPPALPRRPLFFIAVAAVTLVALWLRVYAAQRLDVDYDEPVYLANAIAFARDIRQGDLKMLSWREDNYEHPALYKILYGVVLLTQQPIDRLPDKDLPRQAPIASTAAGPWNIAARYLSVFFGTLAVLVLSLVNPLAGLFLAVDTLSVKYTSEVYLEALPSLASLLCVVFYGGWYAAAKASPGKIGRSWPWLVFSAVCLGIAVAGKYIYGIVVFAILAHFAVALLRRELPARLAWWFAGWAALCVLMFFAFDPYLWPHPLARLQRSIAFHAAFQESRLVQQYHYPFWQPLRWLSAFSAFYDLHPASAFLVDLDTAGFVLALVGVPVLFRKASLFFYWLVIGLLFLLMWETKWPQYTLIVLPPFSLSAAYGVSTLWNRARRLFPGSRAQPAPA